MASIWVGQRVRLRSVEPEDWADFRDFDDDSDVQRNADMVHPPRSVAGSRQWAEETSNRPVENDRLALAIESLADGSLVGSLTTNAPSRRTGRFSYGLAIGREHQRRGYGSDAIVIVLRFMFGERRYHKAEAGIYAFNKPSLALHEHLGFQVEGRLRDHEFLAGRYHDLVMVGMTADEFAARHPYPEL